MMMRRTFKGSRAQIFPLLLSPLFVGKKPSPPSKDELTSLQTTHITTLVRSKLPEMYLIYNCDPIYYIYQIKMEDCNESIFCSSPLFRPSVLKTINFQLAPTRQENMLALLIVDSKMIAHWLCRTEKIVSNFKASN